MSGGSGAAPGYRKKVRLAMYEDDYTALWNEYRAAHNAYTLGELSAVEYLEACFRYDAGVIGKERYEATV